MFSVHVSPRVPLVKKETLVQLVLLVLQWVYSILIIIALCKLTVCSVLYRIKSQTLFHITTCRAHLVRWFSRCPSSHLRRPSVPVTCSQTQLAPSWTTARAWRTSSAHSTTSNRTLNAWSTPWARKTTPPEHAKICSWATQSSLMVSQIKLREIMLREIFIWKRMTLFGIDHKVDLYNWDTGDSPHSLKCSCWSRCLFFWKLLIKWKQKVI